MGVLIENEDGVDTSTGLKDAFAMALLFKPHSPYDAALDAIPNNPDFALWASRNWPLDEYVQQRQAEFVKKFGAEHFLPGKLDVARALWEYTKSPLAPISERTRAMQLYAEVIGIISKDKKSTSVNVSVTTNKVMAYRDHGSDEEWESKLLEQQTILIDDAKNDV